jgi:hypothetical protein
MTAARRMTADRRRPVLLALLAALVMAVAAPAAGIMEPAAARGAATDLTLVTDATYTVDPEAGELTVSMVVVAKNHTRETRTRRFWFDHAFLAVQPGAVNARIGGVNGARVRVAKRNKDSTLLRIDFGSRLYSGDSTRLRLAFDLPGQGKAAAPNVRVGTSLITIPAWAFASAGARGSAVTVRIPEGWEVFVESGELESRTTDAGGATVLSTGPLASPLTWFAFVSAQRPAVYVDRELTVPAGDRDVELVLQAWEDDPAWATRMGALLGDVLPVMRREIGLPWPLTGPLVVQEAVSRDADAYASVFDPAEGRIEVAYWADESTVIHQAAHGWFNAGLLGSRWANEGFATHYAMRTAASLERPMKAPVMPEDAADAQPLNAWTSGDEPGSPADRYGYAASLRLADAIAERVGDDVLARVWEDAADRVGAYQPISAGAVMDDAGAGASAGTREGVEAPPDWRGLLDLIEERSGDDLADLWRERVVLPEEVPLLDARAEARAAYARTVALAGDWRLPRAIRDALRAWRFDTAETLMADARTVIAQRNAVAQRAGRGGVELPDTMRILFEDGSLAEASARAEAERNALLAIESAAVSRSADDDILSRIGMLGEHPEADLAAGRAALAAGDIDTAVAAAGDAQRAWTVAWQEGRRRALLAVAALATVLVLASAVAGSVRRHRRSLASAASSEASRSATVASTTDPRP